MTGDWPPDGYSEPERYEGSDGWMLLIGFCLIIPVYKLVQPVMEAGIPVVAEHGIQIGRSTGLLSSPLLYLALAMLAILCWILIAGAFIVLIHESAHYALGALLGINPRFELHTQVFLKNPSVVAYNKGISRAENILMLGSPFLVLSVLSLAIMGMTSGFTAVTAGIMFAINAVPSCGDIYHLIRISMMPRGTLFANFDDDEGLRTETSVPETP